MADIGQLEQRLTALEQEFAELKQSIRPRTPKPDWLQQFVGSFADNPDFDEIVKLGEEYRKSQRPETHG